MAVLLVSEVFGNSVRHSGSGAPGETVTVAVIAGDGIVRVEVTDRAGPGTPELRPAGGDAEGGRGLQLAGDVRTQRSSAFYSNFGRVARASGPTKIGATVSLLREANQRRSSEALCGGARGPVASCRSPT